MERITALVERLVVGALLILLMVTILVGTVIVGNKVITLNLSDMSWTTLLAIAGLILALAAAIFALRGEHR